MSEHTNASPLMNRIAAGCLLALSLAYGIGGAVIEYAFSSDPLGPRVFPIALAAILGALCLTYLRYPGFSEEFPKGSLLLRIVAALVILVFSVAVFEPLGFLASMFILTVGNGVVFGASWKIAIIGAAGQCLLWWFIFSWLLEVYLPIGDVFG